MSVDVSVVVPVYNTELYLNQCVDSLLAQTLKNVEFIFVDDGSTDRSLEILREYQQKDPRITILQQKNQFAGVARNNGMKAATGKYIIFVDSDDFFEPTMLEEAFNCAEVNQAEIVMFDYNLYDQQTKQIEERQFRNIEDDVFTLQRFGDKFFRYYDAVPWNKLFLRSFVMTHQLQFQPIPKYNDNYFVYIAGFLAKRISYCRKRLVYYRINNNSSLQGNRGKNKELFIVPLLAIKKELKERNLYTQEVEKAFNSQFSYLIKYNAKIGDKSLANERAYYNAIHEHLVPELFESPDLFKDQSLIREIYESENYEDYLHRQLRKQEALSSQLQEKIEKLFEETIPKYSYDYRLGHAILRLPRWILRRIRRIIHSNL